ncbi:MAG TPA: Stk1 family PASTA domain-containing Ser/Thr kinase [Gaiellaceae bacterium]|nr:Stk1 family PASTA domain-containing Ser/Thr kinase [Gaiellaceae bacterium]
MAATDPLIDTLFDGRYKIVRKIGAGGMANVYLAEDQELGRRVAIKILNDRHANDDQFVGRFRQEAKNAAALSHPNIVSIYDRGEAEGTYYIAMEFLDGRSLKELIVGRGPAPVNVAIEYARQILSALRFAHRHGIVHRDIKPHNVLVDGEGRVKVTDFGIARAGASQMTEAGSIVGTAQYLSPEQARGASVDQRSDLYSLGVVLYELLTGHAPFEGDTPVEIAMKHLSQVPDPPSALRTDLPRELDLVVMRALAKDPEDRYQSAEEMEADLERVTRGAPLSAVTEEGATQVMRIPPAAAATAAAATAATTIARPRTPAPPSAGPEYYAFEEHARRRPIWPWFAAALFVLLAAIAGWYVYDQVHSSSKPKVPVELYVNESGTRAQRQIREIGLVPSVKHDSSDTTAKGLVFKQSPDAGKRIPKGSTVTIWVSTGKPKVQVPDVTGKTQDDATKALTDAGFKPDVRHVPGGTAGEVTAEPQAGKMLVKGSTVRINVATGPKPVTVPKVTGESISQATSDLQQLGFKVNPTFGDHAEPANTVYDQNPAPGDQAPKGSTIDLSVSNGPPTATVPDVRGEQADRATSDLENAGFKVNPQLQDTLDPTQAGVVLDESPAGNTQQPKGSTVTITVGNFTTQGTTTTTTP